MDKQTTITTAGGSAPAWLYSPEGEGSWPAVILYMDGIGIRPALHDMARRLAAEGYCVLLPDLYYRDGPWTPLTPAQAFSEGPARERMLKSMGRLTIDTVAADTKEFLDFLGQQPQARAGRVGCVGYCMGGAHALTAAARYPDKVAAAAVFHGARLATDRSDSPHLALDRTQAALYIGVAGIDPFLAPGEMDKFQQALDAAGSRYTMETYLGAKHGFAVGDTPAYDAAAAQRHWHALLRLFDASLKIPN